MDLDKPRDRFNYTTKPQYQSFNLEITTYNLNNKQTQKLICFVSLFNSQKHSDAGSPSISQSSPSVRLTVSSRPDQPGGYLDKSYGGIFFGRFAVYRLQSEIHKVGNATVGQLRDQLFIAFETSQVALAHSKLYSFTPRYTNTSLKNAHECPSLSFHQLDNRICECYGIDRYRNCRFKSRNADCTTQRHHSAS